MPKEAADPLASDAPFDTIEDAVTEDAVTEDAATEDAATEDAATPEVDDEVDSAADSSEGGVEPEPTSPPAALEPPTATEPPPADKPALDIPAEQHEAATTDTVVAESPVPTATPAADPLAADRERLAAEYDTKAMELDAELRSLSTERDELRAAAAGFVDSAKALGDQRAALIDEVRDAVPQLAVAIASRLLHTKITSGDYAVESLVQQLVDRLKSFDPVTVKLHPDDLALLQQRLADEDDEDAVLRGESRVQLGADPALARGECVASAGELTVSSSLKQKLADMTEYLDSGERCWDLTSTN